jgi:diguanylate cyclase (GGDEF)-like protein
MFTGPNVQRTRASTITLLLFLAAICAHASLNYLFPRHSDAITDAFFMVWTIAAAAACINRAARFPRMRRSWQLMAVSLLLWAVATALSAVSEFIAHASQRFATIDDFFYFFYGVPILLAIAAPEDTQSTRLFFWLDSLQSGILGLLAFVAFFHAVPFSGATPHPISVERLVWVFDAEHVLLALLATVRLAVSSRRAPEKRFLQILSMYLWLYAICVGINNHVFAAYSLSAPVDFVIDLPFAAITFATLFTAVGEVQEFDLRGPLAFLLDNARPLVLGLSLVLLAIWVAQDALQIAMGSILAAFVVYGIRSSYLQSRYHQAQVALERARDRLEELVLQDGLTGLANRRCFDQRLQHEWARARRGQHSLSLLLIDIDHFKKLNDAHGHVVGDECLVQVAQALRHALSRPGDLLARYGGEEFVALLPETGDVGAEQVAERLQRALRRSDPVPQIEKQVTISVGVCTCEPDESGAVQALVEAADRALYLAKQRGRDRIEIVPFSFESPA